MCVYMCARLCKSVLARMSTVFFCRVLTQSCDAGVYKKLTGKNVVFEFPVQEAA